MDRIAVVAVLGFRVAYGAALVAAPSKLTERWLGEPTPAKEVALRALGMREVLLHTGALAAALRGGDVRPWLVASMAGDLTDIAATVTARDGLPPGAAPATAAVAGGSALISGLLAARH